MNNSNQSSQTLIDLYLQLEAKEGYPEELKQHPQWLLFKKVWHPERQKYQKIPSYINESGLLSNAKVNERSYFMAFSEASAHLLNGKGDGLGVVLPEGVTCIDVDNDITGRITSEVLECFPESAMELSISGKGTHLFIKATAPANTGVKSKGFYNSQVEVFGAGKFIAMSGKFNGQAIAPANSELFKFTQPLQKKKPDRATTVGGLRLVKLKTLTDEVLAEVIERAKQGKHGKEFSKLFEQGWIEATDVYPSASEADLHLCNVLAFWCQKDALKMDGVFRMSALMRDKWDEMRGAATYGEITIQTAIEGCINTYEDLYYFKQAQEAGTLQEFIEAVNKQPHAALKGEGWEDRNRLLQEKVFQFLNKNLHDVMWGDKQVIVELTESEKYKLYKPADYRRHCEHWKVPVIEQRQTTLNVKRKEIHEIWRLDIGHNHHNGVCFLPAPVGVLPTTTVGGELNLFTGFKVTPDSSDPSFAKARSFLNYMETILCNGDSSHYEFLIKSIAQWFQQPEVKSGVAIILRSAGRGTGKSFFAEAIAHLIGQAHTCKVSNPKDLTGDWNDHFATALYCLVEEATWGGDKGAEGILKDLITAKQVTIRRKFVSSETMDNFTRFIFLTNNDWVVPAVSDERRFFMLDVSEEQKQNQAFFGGLLTGLQSGGYEQLLAYFMSLDLTAFEFRTAPITNALLSQIEQTFCPFGKFLSNALSRGVVQYADQGNSFPHIIKLKEESENIVSKEAFHEAYVQAIKNERYAGASAHQNQIKGLLTKYGILLNETKTRPYSTSERVNCWILPSLKDMKELFTSKTGIPII